jgi:hypothetical protein
MKKIIITSSLVLLLAACGSNPVLNGSSISVSGSDLENYWVPNSKTNRRIRLNDGGKCYNLTFSKNETGAPYLYYQSKIDSTGKVYDEQLIFTESTSKLSEQLLPIILPELNFSKVTYKPGKSNNFATPVIAKQAMYTKEC